MWYGTFIAKQECKQELKSNSGLLKRPVPSHPATIPLWATGGQVSKATKMSTVGENVCSNAPGAALKAVTDMKSTALCSRGSSADLLACDLEMPQTTESSCLWRKNLTSLLSIVHSIPIFSSPLAQQMRSKDKTHTPNGHSSCGSCRFGVDHEPRDKWVSPSTLLCCDGASRTLAGLTAYSTNFRLTRWYNLDYYEH